jgi:exopolyphosphatase / guanosine-5'-triphosphate,3'-diphosphate pyrophosphatase
VIVAIIDIGSNTARLLVAAVEGNAVEQFERDRFYLRLGDDVHALGRIGTGKLEEAERVAAEFARTARTAGAERLETIVTAPGRQAANGDELVRVLADATQAPAVVLTGEDEGRLAWEGAVARMEDVPEVVAVVDLGGGSCELAVGTPLLGPAWIRSLDAGALRVTRMFLGGNPPARKRVAKARREIERLVAVFDPPRPDATLAVGGTARAVGRLLDRRRLEAPRLDDLATQLASVPAETLTEPHGITPERAHTLLGGTLVLAEIARQLGTDLEVGRGGLREGAALALARAEAVAA